MFNLWYNNLSKWEVSAMKKTLITVFLIVFMSIFLCACENKDNESASLMLDNKTYTLYAKDHSIYDGRFTYYMSLVEYENGTIYSFTYPDSSTWSVEIKKGADIATGKIERSEDYGEPCYATGEELYEVYTTLKSEIEDKDGLFNIEFTAPKVIFTALFLGVGIFLIAAPYKVWHIFEGWKFEEEVEPSGAYIGSVAVAGIASIIMAVILFLFV